MTRRQREIVELARERVQQHHWILTDSSPEVCRESNLSMSEPHRLGFSSSVKNRNSVACLIG